MFAGTDRPCREFVTPVLQLFTVDGRCVGFAKIGWDPVTQRMIDDEADALRRVRAAAPNAVRVPEVLWHGYWQGLAVMVTAPMPTDIRRLPAARARSPVDPLAEIAAVDGPVAPTPLGTSDYLRAATETGVRRRDGRPPRRAAPRRADRRRLRRRSTSRSAAGTATGSRGTSAARATRSSPGTGPTARPAVPLGFDVLHFAAIPAEVLARREPRRGGRARRRGERARAPRARASTTTRSRAVAELHRLELELRDTRAWLLRHDPSGCRRTATGSARTVSTDDRHRARRAPSTCRAVARGGALNLVGSIVYGAANFAFLAVVTNALGAERAGPVIVAIAIFTVVSRVAELGASTGLVRMISRDRAVDRPDRIAPTILAACLPVLVGRRRLRRASCSGARPRSPTCSAAASRPPPSPTRCASWRRSCPIAALYTVLVQGSRGFGTMGVLVGVDKIGRACALPVLAALLLAAGGGADRRRAPLGRHDRGRRRRDHRLRRRCSPGARTARPPARRRRLAPSRSSRPSGRSRCPAPRASRSTSRSCGSTPCSWPR